MANALLAAWPMWATLLIVVGSMIFYALDKWSMELVSLGVLVVLLLMFSVFSVESVAGGQVRAADLLAGFGNPALITIMALLVVGQGLFQTGALESPIKSLLAAYERYPWPTLISAFLFVFFISAFINNTPVVIMFLPVMSALASRMGAAPSKLMMPLSFASVFAGMTTLIGTSTNLLAAESYQRITGETLGFFDQTEMGLILAAVGLVYLFVFSHVLLPSRRVMSDDLLSSSGRQFVAQVEVVPGHFLAGARPVAGMFKELPDVTVRMVQRGERAILPPFEDIQLEPGDLVIIAATRQALMTILSRHPEVLEHIWRSGGGEQAEGDAPRSLVLTEAVIAPGSRMSGRTIEMLGFRRLTKAVTLGIQRRSHMIRAKLGEIRLEAGDTLLLCGPVDAFRELRASRDLILLEWSSTEISLTAKVLSARLIALIMVVLAATGLLGILQASLLAALAMIVFGCLNIRQAARSLDLRIFMVIGAALAMGFALEQTGAALVIAETIVNAAFPYGPMAVLSAIFLSVAVMTNLLSNAATAVLFTPIALSAAEQTGAPDTLPYVLAVIFGANCCFATPISYQTNMLVMGPGHYRFSDFLRFGTPLVFLLWAVFTLIAPWRFAL